MRAPAPLTLGLPPEPRRWRGIVLAALAHVALVALLVLQARAAATPGARPGNPGGGAGGGRGGSGPRAVDYILLPAFAAQAAPKTPAAATSVASPTVVAPSVPAPDPAPVAGTVTGAPAGGGAGPAEGPGAGGGIGGGVGADSGAGSGGAGGRGMPPQWRQAIIPPEGAPKELRGRMLSVTFHVTAAGRVERVEVEPAIQDQRYARKFLEAMQQYQFRPARTPDGAPVPGLFTMTVIL